MAHIIKHKKSDRVGVVPHPLELQPGELAINSNDMKLFTVDKLQLKTVRMDRGGVQWDGKDNYYLGDIVTYDNLAYKCIKNAPITPVAQAPAVTPIYWQLVVPATANIIFDPTLDYNEGDIVSVGDNLYVAPVGGIPAYGPIPDPLSPAPWLDSTPDEVGGVSWKTGVTYVVGDTIAIVNPSIVGPGPGGWILYTCLVDHVADAILPDDGSPVTIGQLNWQMAYARANPLFEKGGIAWDQIKSSVPFIQDAAYVIGDTVTESGVTYILTKTSESTPGVFNLDDWNPIARGGIMWKVNTTYEVGDSVMDNSAPPMATYLCTAAHLATTGDSANGSPQQSLSTKWTPDIVEDPGIY